MNDQIVFLMNDCTIGKHLSTLNDCDYSFNPDLPKAP